MCVNPIKSVKFLGNLITILSMLSFSDCHIEVEIPLFLSLILVAINCFTCLVLLLFEFLVTLNLIPLHVCDYRNSHSILSYSLQKDISILYHSHKDNHESIYITKEKLCQD